MSKFLPSSGALDMNTISTTLGGGSSLADYYRAGLYVHEYVTSMGSGNSGVPTTGTISFSNLYGVETKNANFTAYNASGSFTVPAGVTRLYVLVAAGGGGGGGGNRTGGDAPASYSGGNGGSGGLSVGYITVTPGSVITATVGAAGAGGGTAGNGASGGSSSFSTLSATGGIRGTGGFTSPGVNGADGTGSGGNIANTSVAASNWSTLLSPWPATLITGSSGMTTIVNQTYTGSATTQGAVTWSSTGSAQPGQGGLGGVPTVLPVPGYGGIGGAVVVMY